MRSRPHRGKSVHINIEHPCHNQCLREAEWSCAQLFGERALRPDDARLVPRRVRELLVHHGVESKSRETVSRAITKWKGRHQSISGGPRHINRDLLVTGTPNPADDQGNQDDMTSTGATKAAEGPLLLRPNGNDDETTGMNTPGQRGRHWRPLSSVRPPRSMRSGFTTWPRSGAC